MRNPERAEKVEAALKRRGLGGLRAGFYMTLWLVFVWIAVFGEFNWLLLIGAVIVALVVQVVFPLPHHRGLWHIRPLRLIVLVTRFVWDMVRAGLHVAWLVVSGRPHDDAILRCEVRSDNPVYITILAAMTSLVPGTIVVQVDRAHKRIYLHCLDVEAQGGIEGIRQATLAQEARILMAVAPGQVLVEAGLATSRHSGTRAGEEPAHD